MTLHDQIQHFRRELEAKRAEFVLECDAEGIGLSVLRVAKDLSAS